MPDGHATKPIVAAIWVTRYEARHREVEPHPLPLSSEERGAAWHPEARMARESREQDSRAESPRLIGWQQLPILLGRDMDGRDASNTSRLPILPGCAGGRYCRKLRLNCSGASGPDVSGRTGTT